MTTRQELEQAIIILESHRDILEDEVVETAVAVLQEKLLTGRDSSLLDPVQHTTVVVADMSGFTAMSEMMDAEKVRDTINAVWKQLDNVISSWGGKIDQHVGDGMVALFHITSNPADCAERAILAALDMQMELALFNQSRDQHINHEHQNDVTDELKLQMRIGVHSGPVILGQVGSSAQFTAFGDTVAIANQLEQAAPIGGILISENVYDLVHYNFVTESVPPILLADTDSHLRVHIIERERHHALQDVGREVSLNEARFVGRSTELEQLQTALDRVTDKEAVEVITIIGESGVGKSRLRIEFEKLVALQPVPVNLFKGTATADLNLEPYAVIHHFLANYFDIHRRSSPQVSRAKLVQGILSVLNDDDGHAEERAHIIGHLLGFNFDDSPYIQKQNHETHQLRDYAYQDLVKFITTVSESGPVVIFLENLELVDESSLDFLEYLVQNCPDTPLLIICLARPTLLTKFPSCQLYHSIFPNTYKHLELDKLSTIDSRHLISNRLHNIPRPPQRLVDLLLEAASGNPFLIIELIEMMSEVGVIIKNSRQWRVQLGQLNDLRGKLTLTWLQENLLERLTPIEQTVLHKAAIIGETFWDTAVIALLRADDIHFSSQQIQATFESLVQQDLIFRQSTSSFAGTDEYKFRHESFRDVVYATQADSQRQTNHAHFATWLEYREKPFPPNMLASIAHHLEKANNQSKAASWHIQSAQQAETNNILETAIHHYKKALILTTTDHDWQQYETKEKLALVYKRLARFPEAKAIFSEIYKLALSRDDVPAAIKALRSLCIINILDGEYHAALEAADQIEIAAHESNNENALAIALATKGWAQAYLGDLSLARTLGEQALSISTATAGEWDIAYSYALLGKIHCFQSRFDKAHAAIDKGLGLFRAIGDREWEGLLTGDLAALAIRQHNYGKATRHFQESLQIAQNIGDCFGALCCLRGLSKIALRQHKFKQVISYMQRALIQAEKSGNLAFRVYVAADLGRLYLTQHETIETATINNNYLQQARYWLERGRRHGDGAPEVLPRVILQIELARLLRAEGRSAEAQNEIRTALIIAAENGLLQKGIQARKTCAIAWRELGNIAIELPTEELPILVNNHSYDIVTCFQKSIEILSELSYDFELEKAQSLFAWSVFELRWGSHQRGESMWQEAHTIFNRLGMTEEIFKMEHHAL